MHINIDFNKEDLVQYLIQHLMKHFYLEPIDSKIKIGEEVVDILARYCKSRDLVVILVLKEAANVESLRQLVRQRELVSRYLLIKREAVLREIKKINPEVIRNLLNGANGVEGIIIAPSYEDVVVDEISTYPWLQCYTYDFSSMINQTSSADLSVKMKFVFNEVSLANDSEAVSDVDLPENDILNQYIKQNYIYSR